MSLKQAKKYIKLSPKYNGPYKVLQNICAMTYKLVFPVSSRVHPIFHVSCLKKVIGDKILVKIAKNLAKKGKLYLRLKQSWKQELKNYGID